MKKLVLSIGENIETKNISSILMNIEDDLDSEKIAFEGAITVYTKSIQEKYHKFFKNLVRYLSDDLGMILNVYFLQKDVSTNILDVVRTCDRYFFIEGAEISNEKEVPAHLINTKAGSPVESLPELRFIDFKKDLMNQRGLYFGLDKTSLMSECSITDDNISGCEVLGDVMAFNDMKDYASAMSNCDFTGCMEAV